MVRSWLALTLVLVVAVVCFGVRSAVQARRYGDTGWRVARPASAPEAAVHLSLVAGLVLALVAPVAALVAGSAHRPGGIAALADGGVAGDVAVVAGAVLLAGGAVLTLAAQLRMGASWRVGVDPTERTALVTGGPFRAVRNPIFTGMAALVVGEALLVPNALALAAAVLALGGIQAQVRAVEEPYLVATHGPDYARWASRTGRFLPGLGRLHPGAWGPGAQAGVRRP